MAASVEAEPHSINSNSVDGTHNKKEMRGIRNLDGEVSKGTRDSRRKDELITCSRILINIEDQCDEVRREVYGEVL